MHAGMVSAPDLTGSVVKQSVKGKIDRESVKVDVIYSVWNKVYCVRKPSGCLQAEAALPP